MKFGFEHDGFSDDENEQTPLLAGGNVAPTLDPVVAESTTIETTKPSSTDGDHVSFEATPSPDATENSSPLPERATSDKPLPVGQIVFLCIARVVEPIAFFSIFPYINQMCQRNGNLQPSDTGFYSGLIESLFSLTQMCVMIFWGRLSDRFGRKPCLVISLFGIAFATTLFGFAQTIWQMVLFRCAAGIFAGTIVTIRAMITEHSTARTQARAFSWFAFSGNLGIFFGPLIGGALADPNKQYPQVFHQVPFFKQYPYALATLATGAIALIAAILSAVFVDETLPPTSKSSKKPDPESNDGSNTTTQESEEETSALAILRSPGVPSVLYIYSHVMVLGLAYTAVAPVFMYEPIDIGGLGFSSLHISLFMALTGASQAVWLLLIFPPLQHRIGTGGVLRLCTYSWPFFFLCVPLLNLVLRQHTHATTTLFWILCPLVLSVGVGVSMAFTAVQLALNDIAPGPRTLGTLNALALTLVSGLRAVTPGVFPSLFAWGVRNQILGGYFAWLVMIVVAAGLCVGIRYLPEKAEGRVYEEI